jgi:hypothetical protein
MALCAVKKVEPGWKRREEPLHPGSLRAPYLNFTHFATQISTYFPLASTFPPQDGSRWSWAPPEVAAAIARSGPAERFALT